jgi:hypothetical protein
LTAITAWLSRIDPIWLRGASSVVAMKFGVAETSNGPSTTQ